jgi:membrane-bound lytic murein transglycosylase F
MGRYALPCVACLVLAACGRPPTELEQVKAHNELIVITRNSPTTYYEGPDGPTGFEYELAKRFSEYIGVELRVVVPAIFSDILPLTALGDANFAAAGLTVTEKRKEKVRFGPVYQEITPQLVYRSGSTRPKTLADLNGILEVVAGSSHEEQLEKLKQDYPDLSWHTNEELESDELLILVWEQLIEYTIADSNEVSVNRRFYPELKPAFDLSPPEPLAWAFPHSEDDSLFNAANAFFKSIREDGTLERLIDRYYGHIGKFDYVGTRRYQAHIEQRLPQYRDLFIEVANEIGMDWRLLAAIGYQESHWNPDAVSPTGVRGIMMLTKAAAKDLGIKDRDDPEQSIRGGAHYLARMLQRIPERVPEPDRTWLALAAYNVGLGHLEDARILTQKNKGDFDRWVDVKESLPLLSNKKWFQQTRHGYARGREPVRYVDNIRTYYDILVWLTEKDSEDQETVQELPQFDSPAL